MDEENEENKEILDDRKCDANYIYFINKDGGNDEISLKMMQIIVLNIVNIILDGENIKLECHKVVQYLQYYL